MKLSGIIIFCILSFCAFAFENLGPLDKAMKKYPEIFIPESIHTMKIDGKESFVFAGQAEQLFSKKNAETDSELYQEATLAAKNFFYHKLRGKNRNINITMSECDVLYRFRKDKVYTVILFVPVENVTITEIKEPDPISEDKPAAEDKKESVSEDKPAAEDKKGSDPEDKPAAEDRKEAVPEDKPAAEDKKEAVPEDKPAAEEKKEAVSEDKPAAEDKKGSDPEARKDEEDISQEETTEKSEPSVSASEKTQSDESPSAEDDEPEKTIDEHYDDIMKTREGLDSFFDSFFK